MTSDPALGSARDDVGRSDGAQAPAERGWARAVLAYQKNTGNLIATLIEGRGTAEARGEPARALYETLSETARKRLGRGKTVAVKVRWRPLGRAKELLALIET